MEFDNLANLTDKLIAAGIPVSSVRRNIDGTYSVSYPPGTSQALRDQGNAMAASYVDLRYKTPAELTVNISELQAVEYGNLVDAINAIFCLEHPGLINTINAQMTDTIAATVPPAR